MHGSRPPSTRVNAPRSTVPSSRRKRAPAHLRSGTLRRVRVVRPGALLRRTLRPRGAERRPMVAALAFEIDDDGRRRDRARRLTGHPDRRHCQPHPTPAMPASPGTGDTSDTSDRRALKANAESAAGSVPRNLQGCMTANRSPTRHPEPGRRPDPIRPGGPPRADPICPPETLHRPCPPDATAGPERRLARDSPSRSTPFARHSTHDTPPVFAPRRSSISAPRPLNFRSSCALTATDRRFGERLHG